MIPLSYNLRNLRVRRTTTIATALGVGLVVFVLAAALMLSAGIERTMNTSGAPDFAIVLRKGSDAELSSSLEDSIFGIVTSAPGVAQGPEGRPSAVGEVVVVVVKDTKSGNGSSNVLIRGTTEEALALRPEVKVVEGRPPKGGTAEVMVGQAIAGRFAGLSIGDTVELRKNLPAKVVGIFEAGGSSFESEIWGDVFVVRDAFGRDGGISSIRVQLQDPAAFDGFEAAVERDQRLALDVQRESEFYRAQSQGTSTFISAVGIVITIFFSIGAMIGAMITMYGAVSQRQSEVGVLRALGFSRTAIMMSFLFESMILATLGGIIGATAALALGAVEFSMLNFTSFSEIVFRFHPTPRILFIAVACGGIMGILGGLLPAIRAARVSPIEAMRG